MGCPTCGGTERLPLATGYWRCRSQVIDTYTAMAPAPGTPPALGIMAPVVQHVVRECGVEYHDFSQVDDDMLLCSCGTGAIGRCANDQRLVCGFHSDLRNDRRLCSECITNFDRQAHRSAVAAKLEAIKRLADGMCRLRDPSHVFLLYLLFMGMKYFGRQDIPYEESRELVRSLAEPTLRTSSPNDLRNISSSSVDGWSFNLPALLQKWSRSGLLSKGSVLTLVDYQPGLFGRRKRSVTGQAEGWRIEAGSSKSEVPYGTAATPDVYLLANGRLVRVARGSREIDNIFNRVRLGHTYSLYESVRRLVDQGFLRLPVLEKSELDLFKEITLLQRIR